MPFWDAKWGKDAVCAITQTRLRPGKSSDGYSYVLSLDCGHRFYRSALIEWVQQQFDNDLDATCPLCRKTIYLREFEKKK